MTRAYIFDLDDTLLDSTSFTIPEKTLTMLARLKHANHPMAIISFNRSARRIIEYFGLSDYFECIVCDLGDRHELYEEALGQIITNLAKTGKEVDRVFYFDDVRSNIREVEDYHNNSKYKQIELRCIHVKDVNKLYKQV